MKRLLIAFAMVGLLTGCANLNSIKHDFSVASLQSVSIDAKQRAIMSVQKAPANLPPWTAFCAEPSPDALAALSASGGVDVAVLNKALGAAFSTQEGAASIGLRTQTIQILRDAMYRLCEGYASGALDEIGYTRLQRRYQNIMLGLLSIEQLTGATVASQAGIGGNASSTLGKSLAQTTALVAEARAGVVTAQIAATAAKTAITTATKERDAAKTALDAAQKAPGASDDTQAVKDAKAALATKDKALTDATSASDKKTLELGQANKEVESLEETRKSIERAALAASTTVSFNTPKGGGFTITDPTVVAGTVEKIVTTIATHDYAKETCQDTLLSRVHRAAAAGDIEAFKPAMIFCAAHIGNEEIAKEYIKVVLSLKNRTSDSSTGNSNTPAAGTTPEAK
jgi:hypothetical protein